MLPLSVAVLEDMLLLKKGSRLSITPFTQAQ
ncbi:EVE domain-containing protein [Janthinobacterium psychrotolerans]|nr:EVE domain-containing protein [Janthinobacterium psychrotolerans]